LLFFGERVPTNFESRIETLWNAAASAVTNVFDLYGWIVPATLLAILFLGVIVLLCWAMDDLPFELPVFESVRGIFKWMRSAWQAEPGGYSLTK
jgi:hypothetical protein